LAILKKKGALNFKLIVAGQMRGLFHLENESFIRLNGLEKDVILAGFISEEEKSFLYRNAKFVVYPSLYEGFGLPLLESMSVGTPVISSNAASMPEVGGEACLYFNPDSVDDLVTLIDNTLKNKKKLSDLAEAGLNQYKKFNWKNVAMETMKVYEEHKN
jgi:glycosyltransferase involved in cell wall biosynthesis